MRITILTAGSRGLSDAGRDVTLVGGTNVESLVTGYGVNFAPLRADYFALTESADGKSLKSGNPVKAMKMVLTAR